MNDWKEYLRRGVADGAIPPDAPPSLDAKVEARVSALSPMRQIASVRTTGASVFKKPISYAAGNLALLEFPTAELYANLAATQALLDDTAVDLDDWIAAEIDEAFAGQERAAFVNGDGNGKPKGFLSYPLARDWRKAAGEIGYLETGAPGIDVDVLLDLIYAPKPQYRQSARFVMNRKTVSAVRRIKDADDKYIWEPSVNGGSTLLGYPITEIEDMPDIAPGACAIAFGDFASGYLILDKSGVAVLRDPYSAKPYVLFYVTKRVAGGVQNFDAIKVLRMRRT